MSISTTSNIDPGDCSGKELVGSLIVRAIS